MDNIESDGLRDECLESSLAVKEPARQLEDERRMGAQKSQEGIDERVGFYQRAVEIDAERTECFPGSFKGGVGIGDGLVQPLSFAKDHWLVLVVLAMNRLILGGN